MRIPMQNQHKGERTQISAFGGYDRRGDTPENSFFDMKNMTGENYPHISTRKKRGIVNVGDIKVFDITSLDIHYNGRIVKNALIADCENRIKAFFEDEGEFKPHDIFNTTTVLSQKEKTFCVSGTKMYFFPDNIYYDFMDSSVGPLDIHLSYELGVQPDAFYEMVLEPCNLDGDDADSASPYRRLVRRAYKIEGGTKGTLIGEKTFSRGLSVGDTVRIAGASNNGLNGLFNIVNIAEGYARLILETEETLTQSEGVIYIHRDVPEMDYVVSAGNRLWGCRYGRDIYGNCVNEIYASALGDPKNWYKLQGVSTDSWSVSIGCAGAFTGAVCFDGHPLFFKEDSIIKVFGDYPGEFSVVETKQRGIESGSSKSAVFVNDDLYYKTYSGIVRYDGGMPVNVDAPLGDKRYKNAVGGTRNGKYFVSMENEGGCRELFVYDTSRRSWHKEDEAGIVSFTRCGNDLYFLSNEEGKSCIYRVSDAAGLSDEEDFEWYCESGRWGFEAPDRKYVSALQIRIDSRCGSYADVYIEYDSSGKWEHRGFLKGDNSSHIIRLRPRRCDHFRVKLSGKGECSIRSVTKAYESASSFS